MNSSSSSSVCTRSTNLSTVELQKRKSQCKEMQLPALSAVPSGRTLAIRSSSIEGNLRERVNQIMPFGVQTHKNSAQLKFFRSLAPPVIAAVLALSPIFSTPVSVGQTIDIQKGATLFGKACIGCHDMGGNIIQPGATLFTKDLERNGVNTEEEIFSLTYYGKGRMPGFGENCTPKGQCTFGPRLQEEDIKILAEFVRSQADQGWPNVGNYGD